MIIAITGTPGTGKSKVAKELKKILEKKGIKCKIVKNEDLKELIIGYDEKRKSNIIDIKKLPKFVRKFESEIVIFDSHLSHFSKPDICFVLECNIKELRKRLKEREWNKEKIEENVQAEIFKVCRIEALENCKKVFIFDTTNKNKKEIAKKIYEKIKEEL